MKITITRSELKMAYANSMIVDNTKYASIILKLMKIDFAESFEIRQPSYAEKVVVLPIELLGNHLDTIEIEEFSLQDIWDMMNILA